MKWPLIAAGLAGALVVCTGCQHSRPVFSDAGHDLFRASAAHDVYVEESRSGAASAQESLPPITLKQFENQPRWQITLQEALRIALTNSDVIRHGGLVDAPTSAAVVTTPLQNPALLSSVFDPQIVETDPITGLPQALSEFDTQVSTSIFWDKRNAPQNFGVFLPVLKQDVAQFNFTAGKKTHYGTELFFRNITDYDHSNNTFQAVPSTYRTAFEIEARQPLLRGRGRAVNEVPIQIARINTEVSLLDFEAAVRNLVFDVEKAYWDLQLAYRTVEAAQSGLAASDRTLRTIQLQTREGRQRRSDENLTLNTNLEFRGALSQSLKQLGDSEANLRFLLGLSVSDGRIVDPIDRPSEAVLQFDWNAISNEALTRTLEVRRQQMIIRQREVELLAARNQLLPNVNVVGLYRWLGVGDELWASGASGVRFPSSGSRAFEELAVGDYQEARFGVELVMPVYRREMASARNSQVVLIRERARLHELELNASHLLASAIRQVEVNYDVSQIQQRRQEASESELADREKLINLPRGMDLPNLQALLEVTNRSARARADYYRAICDYNKAIAYVHYRKGSLLEYNNVRLAEIPWPTQHYFYSRCHGASAASMDYRSDRVPAAAPGESHPSEVESLPPPQNSPELRPAN